MAVKLAFNRVEQFADGNGVPRPGAKLFTYVGGSVNTKQTTYTESTGTTPNTNPIVLDAFGQLQQPIWLTTGVLYKFVLAPSTDTDPPTSPYWTLDNIAGINDTAVSQSEWLSGPTPTFVSATQFTLVGDQTSTFAKSRRIKATVTAGTVYGTITATAFGALTTVTLALDSGNLDSGLSAVSYGIISPVNPSIDADMVNRKGTAVASAATTDIWSIAGDFVHITGNTGPITSFGTAPYAGAQRTVIVDSTPTLTHNAVTLQLPGSANIICAAGDRFVVRADTTANMIVTEYERAAGTASSVIVQNANTFLSGPASGAAAVPTFRAMVGADASLVLLASGTANVSASLIFTSIPNATYDEFMLVGVNILPATNGSGLNMLLSIDNGSTYETAASSYHYANRGHVTDNSAADSNSTVATVIAIGGTGISNTASGGGISFVLNIHNPASTNKNKHLSWHASNANSASATFTSTTGIGVGISANLTNNDVDAVKFQMGAGNITSGVIYLYGIRKA